MKLIKNVLTGVLAILLGAGLVAPAMGAVACGATGDFEMSPDQGHYIYTINVNWDFGDAAVPERIMLSLDHLVDCSFYDPDDPIQQNYIIPQESFTDVAGECIDIYGDPTNELVWMGGMAMDDPDCWLPTLHIFWENSGPTIDCDPPTVGTGTFSFASYGSPMEDAMYYGVLLIKAGAYCIECDYFGPLPDCNTWAPTEKSHWGTIKALYR